MNTPAQRRPITQHEIDRVQMYTPAPGADNERASLHWMLVDFNTGHGFNPRLTVWTRTPTDPEKRPIDAPMTAKVLEELLLVLDKTCDAPIDTQVQIQCKTPLKDPDSGKRLDGYKTTATIVVGKDKDALIWIAVVSDNPDRPKIKFVFDEGPMHTFVYKDGTRIPREELSIMSVKSTIRLVQNAMTRYPSIITDEMKQVQKETREAMRSGNGQGGGQQRRPSTSFEDITL